MNGEAKPGKTSSKKGIRSLPGLPDIDAIFSSRPNNKANNTYGILPQTLPVPPPIGPSITTFAGESTSRIRSPIDSTRIMINGKVANIDESIENRIGENDMIRPITPPMRQIDVPPMYEEASSPTMIPNNVRIIQTPPRKIEPMPFLRSIPRPPPIPTYERAETVVSSDDDKSIISENIKTPTTVSSVASTPSTAKKKNIRSLLPVFNRTVKNQYPAIPQEELNPLSPVNIPVPIFNTQPRVVSPIQTVGGPKSPSPITRPIFNADGRSFSPTKISPRPATVRAKTPPPIFRRGTQEAEESRNTGYSGHSPLPQRDYSEFGGMKPDFGALTKDQESYLRQEFKMKFGILRANYPQWNVIEPGDSLTVQQMHDLYNHYLHQIMVSRETGQYKVYMVIFLMVIEVIGVKFLKLNMSGYTMSQLKIMNRYDTLFIELGEKWLVSGGSNWPVEARIVMMMLFNAVIFLVVRYLCSWMGVDGLADTLQGWIDGMLNGPSMNMPAMPTGASHTSMGPAPPVPVSVDSSGTTAPEASSGANPFDNIANAFSNFFSNNAGNIGEKIAQIGTVFSGKIQNSNASQAGAKVAQQPPVKKINKKKLFED